MKRKQLHAEAVDGSWGGSAARGLIVDGVGGGRAYDP